MALGIENISSRQEEPKKIITLCDYLFLLLIHKEIIKTIISFFAL